MMTALRVNPAVVSMEPLIANVRDLVLEYRVYFLTTAHRMNIVALTKYVAQIVLENLVCGMATAHQENPVVVWMELLVANALDLVLKNHVKMIPTADQTSIVVIVVKVLLVTVLNLVLENRVHGLTTAHQENIVMTTRKNVSALMLKEICVSQMSTVVMGIVASLMRHGKLKGVLQVVLGNRATLPVTVLPANVVMTIKNVNQHEIAIQKVNVVGNS